MHKLKCVWLFLSLCCCVLGQKKYSVQQRSGYEVQAKEEGSDYESNHYEYEHKQPFPYRFGYDIKDEKGNTHYHKEEGDEHNVKKGSYGFVDAHGVYRHVDYIADHLGFRAKIRTNEPGTANYHPAHVSFHSEPPPEHIYANYNKYQQSDYQQQEHANYGKYQQADYQQEVQVNYGSSPHQEYEKTTQTSYDDEPEQILVKPEQILVKPEQILVKPVHGQQQQSDHGEKYIKLEPQKYTYVPVYVSNNIDYKN